MQNLFERCLVSEEAIGIDTFLNRLAQGQVVELEDFEDYAKEEALGAGYLFWVDGTTGKRYLGSTSSWATFYGLNKTVKEANESQEELINRIADELLTAKYNPSVFSSNVKTGGVSIDFTSICPFREKGTPCPYCYVEAPRKTIKNFVRELVVNNGWTEEDFDQILGKEREVEKPVFHKDVPSLGKKKGEPFKKFSLSKQLYGNQEYQGELLDEKEWPNSRIEDFNKMGGVRLYAFADYSDTAWEDEQLARIFNDADLRGLKIKAITKQPSFVEKWSDRTSVTNLSVDSLRSYGLHSNALPLNVAIEYKKKHPNVRIRTVAFNPEEVVMYTNNDQVDVVTLYHGPTKDLKDKMKIVNMKTGTKEWDQIMALLSDEQKAKLCCVTGKCPTCDLHCSEKGDSIECFDLSESIEDIALECFYKGK